MFEDSSRTNKELYLNYVLPAFNQHPNFGEEIINVYAIQSQDVKGFDYAHEFCTDLLSYSLQDDNKILASNIARRLYEMFMHQNKWDSLKKYASINFEIDKNSTNTKSKFNAFGFKARYFVAIKNEDSAVFYLNACEEIAEKDIALVYHVYTLYSNLYYQLKNYRKALNYQISAIEACEKTNNPIYIEHNFLALIYEELNEISNADSLYRLAIKESIDQDSLHPFKEFNHHLMKLIYSAFVLTHFNDVDQFIALSDPVKMYAEKTQNKEFLYHYYQRKSSLYVKLLKNDSVIKAFEKFGITPNTIKNELFIIINDSTEYQNDTYFDVCRHLMALYNHLGKYDSSLYVASLVDIGDTSHSEIKEYFQYLIQAHSNLKNYKKAFYFQQKYTQLELAHNKENNQIEVGKVIAEYEFKERNKIIEAKRAQVLQNEKWTTRVVILVSTLALVALLSIGLILRIRQKNRAKRKMLKLDFQMVQKELEFEKQRSEIYHKLLMTQMNPHFISNVLSIVHTFLPDQAEKASHYIVKLSRYLRKILDSSRTKWILVKDEIDLLKEYISIIQIIQPLAVHFSYDQELSAHYSIPPFFIQPLLENAILYCDKNIKDIQVDLSFYEDSVIIIITNKISTELVKNKNKTSHSFNIIQERLELFNKEMDQKFYLKQSSLEDKYRVELKIPVLVHKLELSDSFL